MSPGLGATAVATAGALGFMGIRGFLDGTGEPWRFWFLLCMSLWEQVGEGKGVVVQDCLFLTVCLTGKLHPSYHSV